MNDAISKAREALQTFVSKYAMAPDDVEFGIGLNNGDFRMAAEAINVIDSQQSVSGWQPIETAPKDGNPLLLGWYETWPKLEWRCEVKPAGNGDVAKRNVWHHGNATHWMPLPLPPTPETMPELCAYCQSFMPEGCKTVFVDDEACKLRKQP